MTIYDVAKLAGVSIATASKALNGKAEVKKETRERIFEAAKKLDYHPSHLARSLAGVRTQSIGILGRRRRGASVFDNPFYSQVLAGIEKELKADQYNVHLGVVEDGEGGVSMPRMLRDTDIEGLIVLGWMPDAVCKGIKNFSNHCVWVDHRPLPPAFSLLIDNKNGIHTAVSKLKDRGCRSAGFLGGPLNQYSFAERRFAWKEAASNLGLALGPELLARPGAEPEPEELRHFLDSPARPDGVICANDDYALRLMAEAANLGISIPGQLALTGFDDIERAALSQPTLSTLRVDKVGLGRRAVEVLLSMIEAGGPVIGEERFPVRWMQRESC